MAAQARQHEVNGVNRTYFCGAYWRNGFHEDGVVSALNALQHFRAALGRVQPAPTDVNSAGRPIASGGQRRLALA